MLNPYTYRGYRNDQEIGLYYLNSRYYHPEIGRFLNADGMLGEAGDILSTNMYAYCANNPIMNVDPSGNAWYHWVIGGIVAAAPAIARYLWTAAIAYTGSSALAGVVATAVSVGAAALAVSTIEVGTNEAVNALTGTNVGRNLLGDGLYDTLRTMTLLGGAMYISGGMTLPYPSTGRVEQKT